MTETNETPDVLETPEGDGPTMLLAVPTMGAAGMEAQRAGHFGHCDCFTVVDIANGQPQGVREVANPPHEEGGCLRPVKLLADEGVDAIVAAGMGMRPLMGFQQAGITVYFDNRHPVVGDAVSAVISGEAPVMGSDQACNHHH
ncbi:NifB/NifX family molybdenum-iron cluster-binding protein [Xiamenia xianingshaonis]|uniref:NifB/NifX family molybdenum-iron cluster-binding protein n=1 Tax=Xiamenia xianingshaonis TaxID=2682776 RepID=UPI0021BD1DB0|nr:NifB/NifX family molybdenum-iron cluster-binding protein [Xiamenia xianingshaonis]